MSSSRSSTTESGWTVPESTIDRVIGWSRFNEWSSPATLLAAANFLLSSAVVFVSGMLWLTPLLHHGRLCARAFVFGITTISEDTAAKKGLSINVISVIHCRAMPQRALARTLPTLLIETRRCAPGDFTENPESDGLRLSQ
jgi:hypothetical protein